jgi:predicted acylesterase/phospholipase RssA
MRARCLAVTAVLLAVILAPVSAQAASGDCPDRKLPYALNIGVSRLSDSPTLQPADLEKDIEALFQDFYAEHGRCPSRQLQINIMVASDYEILDWLGHDLLDAAVVPDLTVYLLQRDHFPLREMEVADHPVGDLLLPAVRKDPLSGRLVGGDWQAGNPRADFAAFLEQSWRQALRPASGDREDGPAPAYRIVLASHLSTPGFLDPVTKAAEWMQTRMPPAWGKERRRSFQERFWQAFFENARFAVDCDSLEPGDAQSCWRPPENERILGNGPTEILFPGESVLRRLPANEKMAASSVCRERLVLSGRTADELFASGLSDAKAELPEAVKSLFEAPPAAWAPILDAEPSFGVRTFGFTVDESLRLLRQNQSTSGRKDLALVLPGGGVKAAYQSGIVDELYRRRSLRNEVEPAPAAGRGPLPVKYVIGTSGGALLGFFVSQLGERGPWGLSRILWQKSGDAFMESTDVFGWTDLLRYVSVVASFLVLCALLALASVPENAPLSPRPKVGSSGYRRGLMLGVLLPILFFSPLLVRWVSGEGLQEQVPEFGGLVYAVLAMIAMVADQSLIHEEQERPESRLWLPPALAIAAGLVLTALPLLCRAVDGPLAPLRRKVTFGPAFAVLAPLVLLGGLVLPLRSGRVEPGPRGWLRLALDFLLPAGLALALAVTLPRTWLNAAGQTPFFLTGFLLVLVCVGANYFLGHAPGGRDRKWWLSYAGTLVAAALLLLILCWPQGGEDSRLREAFGTQTLEITLGTFLLCIGLVVLMLGGIAWAYASHRRYHLRLRELLIGFFVALLHAVAVYLVLYGVMKTLPDWLSPLELTGAFWLWLLGASLILGTVLLLAGLGRLGRRDGKAVGSLRSSLEFLCSHHPNGNAVTRRFMRLAVLGVLALSWWNLVLAPALYGNRSARKYLGEAVHRFEKQTGARKDRHLYRPTARFIVPANLLAKDGTRYFLFVPQGDECPPIPQRSGAQWLRYEASAGDAGGFRAARTAARREPRCDGIPDKKFLEDVIFASGSPFPIFPAHRLELKPGAGKEPLVDGGYSNKIPVDVALSVEAEQVLIVDSSSPLESPTPSTLLSRLGDGLTGELVKNLSRLPGFLFERSQQIDRLSRRDLFVVSLAPSRDEVDWPALFDFRPGTVERMESVALRDLRRRIGLVESWGRPPRAQLSVPVEGRRRDPVERAR